MARTWTILAVFLIASCAFVHADESEEEQQQQLGSIYGNPWRGDYVQGGAQYVDPEEMEEPEEPEAAEIEEPEEPEAAEVEEPEEPEAAEVEEPEEPEAAEVEEPEEPEAAEVEEPEAGEMGMSYSASSSSMFSSVGGLNNPQGQVDPAAVAGGDSSAEVQGGAMVNPNVGGAQVAPGDNSEEVVGMVGGAAQTGGTAGESESNEEMGGGGMGGGSLGSVFTIQPAPATTGPPPIIDTTTMAVATSQRTPEPIRGDGVPGIAAAETNNAEPQTMTKKQVGLAAGLGTTAGVVGIAAAGAGIAFKAGLIGGGGGAAAAGAAAPPV